MICEIRFFNEDVLSLIQKIKTVSLGREREIPILLVSAYCAAGFAQNLLTMVEDYLLKPIDVDYLADEVWNLVHLARLNQKVNIRDWAEKHRVWAKHNTTAMKHLAAALN